MELKEKLLNGATRPRLVQDCCDLIDSEVASKKGVSGLALKGAYKLVKGVKPGFVKKVVDNLLDDWVEKLSPFYETWKQDSSGATLGGYLGSSRDSVADKLLEVTDSRARGESGPVTKTYNKLRPTAKNHVAEAVPALGEVVQRHV